MEVNVETLVEGGDSSSSKYIENYIEKYIEDDIVDSNQQVINQTFAGLGNDLPVQNALAGQIQLAGVSRIRGPFRVNEYLDGFLYRYPEDPAAWFIRVIDPILGRTLPGGNTVREAILDGITMQIKKNPKVVFAELWLQGLIKYLKDGFKVPTSKYYPTDLDRVAEQTRILKDQKPALQDLPNIAHLQELLAGVPGVDMSDVLDPTWEHPELWPEAVQAGFILIRSGHSQLGKPINMVPANNPNPMGITSISAISRAARQTTTNSVTTAAVAAQQGALAAPQAQVTVVTHDGWSFGPQVNSGGGANLRAATRAEPAPSLVHIPIAAGAAVEPSAAGAEPTANAVMASTTPRMAAAYSDPTASQPSGASTTADSGMTLLWPSSMRFFVLVTQETVPGLSRPALAVDVATNSLALREYDPGADNHKWALFRHHGDTPAMRLAVPDLKDVDNQAWHWHSPLIIINKATGQVLQPGDKNGPVQLFQPTNDGQGSVSFAGVWWTWRLEKMSPGYGINCFLDWGQKLQVAGDSPTVELSSTIFTWQQSSGMPREKWFIYTAEDYGKPSWPPGLKFFVIETQEPHLGARRPVLAVTGNQPAIKEWRLSDDECEWALFCESSDSSSSGSKALTTTDEVVSLAQSQVPFFMVNKASGRVLVPAGAPNTEGKGAVHLQWPVQDPAILADTVKFPEEVAFSWRLEAASPGYTIHAASASKQRLCLPEIGLHYVGVADPMTDAFRTTDPYPTTDVGRVTRQLWHIHAAEVLEAAVRPKPQPSALGPKHFARVQGAKACFALRPKANITGLTRPVLAIHPPDANYLSLQEFDPKNDYHKWVLFEWTDTREPLKPVNRINNDVIGSSHNLCWINLGSGQALCGKDDEKLAYLLPTQENKITEIDARWHLEEYNGGYGINRAAWWDHKLQIRGKPPYSDKSQIATWHYDGGTDHETWFIDNAKVLENEYSVERPELLLQGQEAVLGWLAQYFKTGDAQVWAGLAALSQGLTPPPCAADATADAEQPKTGLQAFTTYKEHLTCMYTIAELEQRLASEPPFTWYDLSDQVTASMVLVKIYLDALSDGKNFNQAWAAVYRHIADGKLRYHLDTGEFNSTGALLPRGAAAMVVAAAINVVNKGDPIDPASSNKPPPHTNYQPAYYPVSHGLLPSLRSAGVTSLNAMQLALGVGETLAFAFGPAGILFAAGLQLANGLAGMYFKAGVNVADTLRLAADEVVSRMQTEKWTQELKTLSAWLQEKSLLDVTDVTQVSGLELAKSLHQLEGWFGTELDTSLYKMVVQLEPLEGSRAVNFELWLYGINLFLAAKKAWLTMQQELIRRTRKKALETLEEKLTAAKKVAAEPESVTFEKLDKADQEAIRKDMEEVSKQLQGFVDIAEQLFRNVLGVGEEKANSTLGLNLAAKVRKVIYGGNGTQPPSKLPALGAYPEAWKVPDDHGAYDDKLYQHSKAVLNEAMKSWWNDFRPYLGYKSEMQLRMETIWKNSGTVEITHDEEYPISVRNTHLLHAVAEKHWGSADELRQRPINTMLRYLSTVWSQTYNWQALCSSVGSMIPPPAKVVPPSAPKLLRDQPDRAFLIDGIITDQSKGLKYPCPKHSDIEPYILQLLLSDWQDAVKVEYAVAFGNASGTSKLSKWSQPLSLTDKPVVEVRYKPEESDTPGRLLVTFRALPSVKLPWEPSNWTSFWQVWRKITYNSNGKEACVVHMVGSPVMQTLADYNANWKAADALEPAGAKWADVYDSLTNRRWHDSQGPERRFDVDGELKGQWLEEYKKIHVPPLPPGPVITDNTDN